MGDSSKNPEFENHSYSKNTNNKFNDQFLDEIPIISKIFTKTKFALSDVNPTAVNLSKTNVQKNNIKNIDSVILSNAYQNIDKTFDYIISNPPIKAGKKVLLDILLGSYDKLNDNGKLIFVIKKKFGEDSIKKQLQSIFKTVEIINRDSGYYILMATK